MEEIWKPIPGYEGFMASSIGRIKSIDHTVSHPTSLSYRVKGRIRKLMINWQGYKRIQLEHRGTYWSVHRLVAMAFIPNHENLPEVNHINGIKGDDRVENLEWCTRIHNLHHARSNGLLNPPRGLKHTSSKLDETQVKTIRVCLNDGMRRSVLARYFKVGHGAITSIRDGRSYRDVL